MSFTFIAMMMLVGSSVVIAFVLQPSKEEPAASANSPVSHHRSVSNLFVRRFVCLCSVLLLLVVTFICMQTTFKTSRLPNIITKHLVGLHFKIGSVL